MPPKPRTETVAKLEAMSDNHAKDISELKEAIHDVVASIKEIGNKITNEVTALRRDVFDLGQKHVEDGAELRQEITEMVSECRRDGAALRLEMNGLVQDNQKDCLERINGVEKSIAAYVGMAIGAGGLLGFILSLAAIWVQRHT